MGSKVKVGGAGVLQGPQALVASGRGLGGASRGTGRHLPGLAGKGQSSGQRGPRAEGGLPDPGSPGPGEAGGEPHGPSAAAPGPPPRTACRAPPDPPEHGLHKHTQRLEVHPGDEGFAEVHLEPAQQGALRRQRAVTLAPPPTQPSGPARHQPVTSRRPDRASPEPRRSPGQRKQRVDPQGPSRPRATLPGGPGAGKLSGQPPAHARGHRRPGSP